jgi:hypothetical protein
LTFQHNTTKINGQLFADSVRRVLRAKAEFAEEEAVILLDNCHAHVTQEVVGILPNACRRFETLAPHMMNIVQVIGLTLCGAFEKGGQHQLPFETENSTSDVIVNVDCNFRAMIDTNIFAGFRHIGLIFDPVGNIIHLQFHEIQLREPANFQKL